MWGGVGHKISRVGWGGCFIKSTGGVGGSCRGRVGHVVKQHKKNVSHQNQDLTPPKSFLEGVQNLSVEYKNYYYYYFIITIVLYSQLYQKIITRYCLYKNLDGMIMLVPREKSRKVACVLNGTEMLSLKATTNKNMPSPHIIQKAVDNNFSEEETEHLTCDRSNYSVKIFTSPLHPCMTHPASRHDPPLPLA